MLALAILGLLLVLSGSSASSHFMPLHVSYIRHTGNIYIYAYIIHSVVCVHFVIVISLDV